MNDPMELARRFFPVWVKARQGHGAPLMPRQRVQEIQITTCDLAELTYLRELRQAIIEAGYIPYQKENSDDQ